MKPGRRARLLVRLAPMGTLLAFGACYDALSGSAELLLGGEATENLLRLPTSAIYPYIEFILRFLA